jgi:tetratricopeptide (TPR) repeat protein
VAQILSTGKPRTSMSPGIALPPVTPDFIARLQKVHTLNKAAEAALDAGRYAEAEAEARQSVSIRFGSSVGQEILASSLYAQGKTQEALQAYKVMADAGGDFSRNLLPYSFLLLKTGHWAEAVAAYNKQLPDMSGEDLIIANSHFSPTKPEPRELATAIHIGLGLAYEPASWGGHSQEEKAMNEYQKALALEPDSPLANLYYARKLHRIGRKVEAQAYFEKASKFGSGDVKAAAEKEMK